jgi:N-acetyl-gamma-glutamyl-phosphate reductase
VAIVGATGYVGAELVRLLGRHPNVEVVGLVGRDRTAEPIDRTHAHLSSTGLRVDAARPESDAVFLALPHGTAAGLVGEIVADGTAVIDLGPDFRLHDPTDYPTWYGFDHPAQTLLADAVYGLPELHRSELTALADRPIAIVGSPGCYPTTTLLALAPLAQAGLIGDLVVDAKSGVSGAGRAATEKTHFVSVDENVSAYGVPRHRHTPEIEQELSSLGAKVTITFTPHLLPLDQGELVSCYVSLNGGGPPDDARALYLEAYATEPFVEVVEAPPGVRDVRETNICRISAHSDARTGRMIVFGAIDNLWKGAASQAVQNLNLMFGLPEEAGIA